MSRTFGWGREEVDCIEFRWMDDDGTPPEYYTLTNATLYLLSLVLARALEYIIGRIKGSGR